MAGSTSPHQQNSTFVVSVPNSNPAINTQNFRTQCRLISTVTASHHKCESGYLVFTTISNRRTIREWRVLHLQITVGPG